MNTLLNLKILVTGAGGDIGLSVGRILRKEGVARELWGTDLDLNHPGRSVFDSCFVLPRADSSDYLDTLERMVLRLKPDVLIPVSEPEIRRLHKEGISGSFSGIPVVIANPKSLDVGFDKLATARFLDAIGLPSPWTVSSAEEGPRGLPCILKDRASSGSRSILTIRDKRDLDYYSSVASERTIWQEYLSPDDQEYTCGLFRSAAAGFREIQFHRKLQGGLTGSGRIVRDTEIESQLRRLADALDLAGSINVQLRITSQGPVIFEINPRFSSTVMFRHKLGFQDLIWSVQAALGVPVSEFVPPQAGTRFYRTSQEVFFSGD